MIGRHILEQVRALARGAASGRKPPPSFARTVDGVDYVGWVDGVRNGRLVGWAASASPRDRLTIAAEGADKRLGARADRYRADVQRLGYSASGYCGFSFPLAPFGGAPVRVFVSKPRFELGGSPAGAETVAPTTSVQQSSDGRWLVAIDADSGRLSGWACDRRSRTRRPLLQLEYEGMSIESCRATLYRRDAVAALGELGAVGDGWRGFSFAPPRKSGVYVIRDTETAGELYWLFSKASG